MSEPDPDQLPPVRKFLLAGGMFVVGYLAMLLPLLCVSGVGLIVVLVAALLNFFYNRRHFPRGSSDRLRAGWLLTGVLAKVVVTLVTMMLVTSNTTALQMAIRSTQRHSFALILLVGEPGQFEALVRRYTNLARRGPGEMDLMSGNPVTADPFSGQPFLSANGKLHSVGPDLVDNGLATTYDPTNGTVSGGDIAVRGAGGK